jgi:hypothetical protein
VQVSEVPFPAEVKVTSAHSPHRLAASVDATSGNYSEVKLPEVVEKGAQTKILSARMLWRLEGP